MPRWMPLVLVLIGVPALVLLGAGAATSAAPDQFARGQQLYQQACQTCHLADGSGQPKLGVPSLHAVGAAAVDFYVGTGRMPEANLARQAPRKPPQISAGDRAALVTYVTTRWPGGPGIPAFPLANGVQQQGGDTYRTNCAACHGAAGAGAALAHGAYAPSLSRATPIEVAEAVRVGPGNMPVFGPNVLSDAQVADVAAYVQYLHHPDDRGGLGLGHTGPIAEGFVGLVVGLLAMAGLALWVGGRAVDHE